MTNSDNPDLSDHDYLELFFDLVFVFGVSQLSHYLLAHLSWRGAAETATMLLAIFVVWFSTSWSATLIDSDRHIRRMMLTVMLLSLFMNASVTEAFVSSSWEFVVPLLLVQVGRAVWTLINSTKGGYRGHYFRVLLWVSATTPLWIAGAAVGPEARLLWWALAAGIDTLGRLLGHPIPGRQLQSENMPFDAEHMVNRCRLFLIIALGESVFTTGTAIAEASTKLMTLLTGTAALAVIVALWALNFSHSTRLNLYYREETSDPVRTGSYAVHALTVMVAGLVLIAVANELVIAQPGGGPSVTLSLLLFGGPSLYLVAQGWYLWTVPQEIPYLRLLGSAALILVGLTSLFTPPFLALVLVSAILTTLALLNQRMST